MKGAMEDPRFLRNTPARHNPLHCAETSVRFLGNAMARHNPLYCAETEELVEADEVSHHLGGCPPEDIPLEVVEPHLVPLPILEAPGGSIGEVLDSR